MISLEEFLNKPSTIFDGTWEDWLKSALLGLLKEGEGFNGKRPNCNSGWQEELAGALAEVDPDIVYEWEKDGDREIPYSVNWELYETLCQDLVSHIFLR